jgi:hypothetical protein
MAVLGTDYRKFSKRNMPNHWFEDLPDDHLALTDAVD